MKKWVKALIAVVITAAVFWLLQKLLVPKYVKNVTEGAFTAEYYSDEPNHDVLILGDCDAYENIDPVYLWEHYGINAYIRGNAQQLVWQSYYMLEDALKYETPKVVVMSVLDMKYGEPQSEAYNRLTLDGMKFGLTKAKAVLASMTEDENFIEYLLPLLRFHDRITELSEEDVTYMFSNPKVSHNGYYLRVDSLPAENVPEGAMLADYSFSEKAWDYLNRIADTCEEKGIKLLLIKAPSLYPYWYDEWDSQIRDFADEHGLDYINYLELADEIGIDYSTDTYDGGLHLNLYGADKLTEHLGSFLSENYGLEDRSVETDLAADWDVKIALYYKDISEQLAKLDNNSNNENADYAGENSGDTATASATPVPAQTASPTQAAGTQPSGSTSVKTEGYCFKYGTAVICMDESVAEAFTGLPAYDSVYVAPSCAFEGNDRVYAFGSFEIDTYESGGNEYVAAVIFKDDLVETAEGAYIGMDEAAVKTLYGDGKDEGGSILYEKGGMKLRIFVKDGIVTQIQYLSAVLD